MLRRFSSLVLFLWVSFLALAYLQPCCEAVASALPHDHRADSGRDSGLMHAHDEPHVAPGTGGQSEPQHRHCAQSFELPGPLPVAVADRDRQAQDPRLATLDVVLFELYGLAPRMESARGDEGARAPPTPVFLATRRLRI